MVNKRLILIEGFPGAGKTTTLVELGNLIRQHGSACRCYLDEDDPHPIACLDFKLQDLSQKMPRLWRDFTNQALKAAEVTIIESRLWQNTTLFMYMDEFPLEEIVEPQRLVAAELSSLSPVLVYLYQTDIEKAIDRLRTTRDEQILANDLETTAKYAWFKSRGLTDLNGWVVFFEEWASVAEELFGDWLYRKLEVENPHEDWGGAISKFAGPCRLNRKGSQGDRYRRVGQITRSIALISAKGFATTGRKWEPDQCPSGSTRETAGLSQRILILCQSNGV